MDPNEIPTLWQQAIDDGDLANARQLAGQMAQEGLLLLQGASVMVAGAQNKAAIGEHVALLQEQIVYLAHALRLEPAKYSAHWTRLCHHITIRQATATERLVRRFSRDHARAAKVGKQISQTQGGDHSVRDRLELNGVGNPVPSLSNLVRILESDPRWKGRLRYNEMARRSELDGQRFEDVAQSEVAIEISDAYSIHTPTHRIAEAMGVVARRETYHPVRDYLDGLTWDGVPRLDDMLARYFRGQGVDDDLLSAYGRCWMLSAVARVRAPGVKADCLLVLTGEQGLNKSQALQVLAGSWWSESNIDVHSKDGYQCLRGPWLYEVAEFDRFSKRDTAWLKAFFSSRIDRYRPSFARNEIEAPRQCVFYGTTNKRHFLSDPTGGRRYWVVHIPGRIDLQGLAMDRDQLWAEADQRQRCGEQHWLSMEMEGRHALATGQWSTINPWRDTLETALRSQMWPDLTTNEVLDMLKVPTERQRGLGSEVAGVMRQLGYRAERPRTGGVRRRVWIWHGHGGQGRKA